ncbi:amino acid adenylation domain-containing protein, partial [Myxococcota bacterium]|nr:amino acid adenylation domain-containing protein [Myxococcota bacterium]
QTKHSALDIAIVEGETELNYAQLRQHMSSLAYHLSKEGAAPSERVVILARPGIEAVVGTLGILGSSAAYVPIDPEYPDGRLEQIAGHSRAKIALTTSDQIARLSILQDAGIEQVILVDEPTDLMLGLAPSGLKVISLSQLEVRDELPPNKAEPLDLAYIMYTSGTTAKPKGVMVQHQAFSQLLGWIESRFEITSRDRFIQTAPLTFGSSLRQMFSPLLVGGRVYTVPRGLARDPEGLVHFIEEEKITIYNSVPTLWMLLLDAIEELERNGEKIELEALRWVLIGGEDLPTRHVRRWMDRYSHRHRIVNLYGGAETIVNALHYEVQERPKDDTRHIPIGSACAGAEANVLDTNGEVCRQDESGELVVGGTKLAKGYWDDAERTAASFVEHPTLGRIFHTGDLARREASGEIVYLGRADTQVKVHGHRVELSEIESALGQHEWVRAAAVILTQEGGHDALLAFVEPGASNHRCDVRELRAFVAELLPSYMLPKRVEWIDALPRNHIGKIDRRALTQPEATQESSVQTAPNTSATQDIIAKIWCEVLALPSVEYDQDFFELGGDSILALDVLQRLRGQVPVLPRPLTLYSERTVNTLAAALDKLAVDKKSESKPITTAAPTIPDSENTHLALTPTQESFVLAQRMHPENPPLWCARLPIEGELEPVLLTQAMQIIVQRHALLRTVFETDTQLRTTQYIAETKRLPLSYEDLRGQTREIQEQHLQSRFLKEQDRNFDLAKGPLWQLHLAQLGEAQSEIQITMHHAIGDGWSSHILGVELLSAYEDLEASREISLPTLRSSFADVVKIQGNQDEQHEDELEFWGRQFKESWPDYSEKMRALREAPLHPEEGEVAQESPHTILTTAQTLALRARARTERCSLHALVLTTWLRVLRKHLAQEDIVLGIATHGRDLPLADIDRIVAPLTVALPLRIRLNVGALREAPSFTEELAHVERTFADAIAHSSLPIDKLLQEIPRHPGAPYPPGQQLFFSFMDFSALPQLKTENLSFDLDRAHFHFETGATNTEFMLGAIAGDSLRLHLHGQAALSQRDEALEMFVKALNELANDEHFPNPSSPSENTFVPAVAAGFGAPRRARHASPPHPENARIDAALIAYLPAPTKLSELWPTKGSANDFREQARN